MLTLVCSIIRVALYGTLNFGTTQNLQPQKGPPSKGLEIDLLLRFVHSWDADTKKQEP